MLDNIGANISKIGAKKYPISHTSKTILYIILVMAISYNTGTIR